MHCHHLHPYHSRSFLHNQSRNLPFHYVVEAEIHSNLEFRVFGQSISTDLDHLQYFKNNTLGLIPDVKAYFNRTDCCKLEDLQSSGINAGSEKFMTSEIFRSFCLQMKVYALFIYG